MPSKFLWLFISLLVLCVFLCIRWIFHISYICPRWHEMHSTHVEHLQQCLFEMPPERCAIFTLPKHNQREKSLYSSCMTVIMAYIAINWIEVLQKPQTCKSYPKKVLLRALWVSIRYSIAIILSFSVNHKKDFLK